jgi:hypothetical protein
MMTCHRGSSTCVELPRVHTGPVLQENLGSLIGAAFGLVFVLVNTSTAATAIAVLLRVLGVVAFLVVVIAVCRPGPATGTRAGDGGFSRRFWLVVAAEVLAIWIGLALLNGPLHTPHAAVAWVSSVVGAHFIALALVCRNPLFHWLGAALLGCGVVGLVLAGRGTDAGVIALVGGVLPGAILLGFGLWGSTRGAGSYSAQAVP